MQCNLIKQGFERGSCDVKVNDKVKRACEATLKFNGTWHRLIKSIHLSRPEDYLSIYQSGCNHSCLKCHSWYFTQIANGYWLSTDQIAETAEEYEKSVTVKEPRKRATMWHATDLCRHCGSCVLVGRRGELCPKKLSPEQIVWSPQGYGPARNIVAFTGGDIVCKAEFYAEAAEKIKEKTKLWVLIETNGYGLTPKNLDLLANMGVDSFWLDIKAYNEEIYRKLCGTTNRWILKTPEWIVEREFVLEICMLYVPHWIEIDQLKAVAKLIADIDERIPFTILAYFPEYKMKVRSPNLMEMIQACLAVRDAGIKNVKLGNLGVFAKSDEEVNLLFGVLGDEIL
ncbi:radical SAM protein [Archaeoglobales archaeon]|nr:MAG: radical SAM protein [Archaeoglobales archaeon]